MLLPPGRRVDTPRSRADAEDNPEDEEHAVVIPDIIGTDYVWYNYRVFFIFWIVFGICAAARRIDAATRRQKHATVSEYCADITID